MEDSSEQNWNNREFSLLSISDLSSDASSVSPGIASFKPDRLQIQPESQQIPLNFDLQTAQIFKLGAVKSVCIMEGSDVAKTASYSTGVTIEFKNEEECEAFHSAVQQWIKENNVQGAAL